jgi:hypothetical protein
MEQPGGESKYGAARRLTAGRPCPDHAAPASRDRAMDPTLEDLSTILRIFEDSDYHRIRIRAGDVVLAKDKPATDVDPPPPHREQA